MRGMSKVDAIRKYLNGCQSVQDMFDLDGHGCTLAFAKRCLVSSIQCLCMRLQESLPISHQFLLHHNHE